MMEGHQNQNHDRQGDPLADLRDRIQHILDTQTELENSLTNLHQAGQPKLPPFQLNGDNASVGGEHKLGAEIKKLKEILKGMSSAETLMDIHGLAPFPNARIPQGFKMPNITKFDGIGNPTIFLKMYVGSMTPWGVTEELMAQFFQQYLDGAAAQWFFVTP